ncbi:SprT family zinc-dependent metalloprotease [Motilimonas eburnea]|uniref:SprT family zinc-dependent metalloprotease n=1 Tax=Motilimonas eburnea TaxID=1737488 RepID=UPI001E49D6D4|nr:SprT family zinc-dependent metalloprotease [Motilimonas eburnea]
MVTSSQKQALEQQVEACYQLAECFFDRPFQRPTIQYNQRGKIAGSAHLQKHLLKFNPVLYQENQTCFLVDVVPHEVSHLLVYQLHGASAAPHGREWQFIMTQVMKRPARRTHQFDISSVAGKTFLYHCQCQQHQLSIRRHNKVKKGTQYLCTQCKTSLQEVKP